MLSELTSEPTSELVPSELIPSELADF